MGILKNEYKSFLDDIEKNIKNKEDLEYIRKRFTSFMDAAIDEIDNVVDYKKEEIEKLEKNQQKIEEAMQRMQQVIDNIEKDIYAEDGFDFEIICPYCDYEFIIDMDEEKKEIECPECQNVIELDWSGDLHDGCCECDCNHEHENEDDFACGGSCGGCHGCDDEENEEDM